MIKFLLYIISFVGSVFLFSMAINYGLKLAGYWDDKISNKLNRSFQGFNWYFRVPFSIGVIPEIFCFFIGIRGIGNPLTDSELKISIE